MPKDQTSFTRKPSLLRISMVFAVLFVCFAYGVAVGKYQLFPFNLIKSANLINNFKAATSSLQPYHKADSVDTNQFVLEKHSYNLDNVVNFTGGGGSITPLGDQLIGVDRTGTFFLYSKGGRIEPLDIALETNLQAFSDALTGRNDKEQSLRWFRVYDLKIRVEGDDKNVLFATYHYWDSSQECVQLRISRVALPDVDLTAKGQKIESDAWETIFVAKPCLKLKGKGSDGFPGHAFAGHQVTGRLAVDSEENVIFVVVGDAEFDGLHTKEIYPQDDSVSYGKVLRIDLDTSEHTVVSKGHRNPQGMLLDTHRNLWITEHGPKGGDELNLIQADNNYGWPLVTYGTHYGTYDWPLNKEPGRHEGYERPAFAWVPSIGISNLIEVQYGPERWSGDLLVSSLSNSTLSRLRIEEDRVIFVEPLKIGERIRDLAQLKDGTIVLWTDSAQLIELREAESDSEFYADNMIALTDSEVNIGLENVINSCMECHRLQPGPPGNTAPSLWGIYGRGIANSEFPGYSESLESVGGTWNEETLRQFLSDPQKFAPGTPMMNPAIGDQATLESLIGYLKRLK